MNKVKSAICFALITVVIAGLIFMCSAMFPYGHSGRRYNNILSMTDKDAQYGGLTYDDGDEEYDEGKAENKERYYRGGGFVAVYYPEGVISEKEYHDNLAGYETDAEQQQKYEEDYRKVGAFYFEKDLVEKDGDGYKPTAAFEEDFASSLDRLKTRFDSLEMANVRVSVRDKYSVAVYLPSVGATIENSELLSVFGYARRMGEFTVAAGTSEDAATELTYGQKEVSAGKYEQETIRDYIKRVYAYNVGSVSAVGVDFTPAGAAWLSTQTATAADGAVSIYFRIGGETVASVSTQEQITASTIYLSKTSAVAYTAYEARCLSAAMRTSMDTEGEALSFTVGEYSFEKAQFGDLALILLYVAFAALAVGMLVFFFVRYHGLAVAHLYSFLIYLLLMIVLVWAIPFLNLNAWTVVAVALGGLLLSVCNALSYENARKEYALGKTMESSVKTGYKKCFWLIFDLHIVIALLGFVAYFISLTQLSVFAFTLGLGAVLSGLCSLAVNRFHWAMLMTFTKKPGAFCNFKREEVSDDE